MLSKDLTLARSLLFVATLTAFPALSFAQDGSNRTSTNVEPASIVGTEEFTLYSENVGANYLVQVAKPLLLAPPTPEQKFPVIYVTDGITNFASFASPARALPLEGSTVPAYVVAVGYPNDVPVMQQAALRMRDLLHEPVENIPFADQSGGAAAFERFLVEELRPEIENRYPIDSTKSTLAGHSLGGLFAATVMRNNPDAFSTYMIGSPSLQFDSELIDEIENMSAQGQVSQRVFLSVGTLEGGDELASRAFVAAVDNLEQALTVDGSTAVIHRMTFENETHMSVVGAWISHGLRFVLNE